MNKLTRLSIFLDNLLKRRKKKRKKHTELCVLIFSCVYGVVASIGTIQCVTDISIVIAVIKPLS